MNDTKPPTKLAIYHELVPWYRLLDPTEEHRDEAEVFTEAFKRAVSGSCATLLELGAGAGNDDQCQVDYAFLLRRGTEMKAVHDSRIEGMFAEATWRRILAGAGFEVELIERPIGEGETDRVFLCRRPRADRAQS